MTNVFIADVLPRMVRLALAVLLAVTASNASGTGRVAPERPLELRERVASTVGDSPFIAVGRVIAAYDTVVSNGGRPGSFAVVLFEPIRVLRGEDSKRRLRVVFWKTPDAAPDAHAGDKWIWPPRYLPDSKPILVCFEDISRYRAARPVRLRDAAAGVSGWAAGDALSPNSIPRLLPASDSVVTLVRDEIRAQEPETLAQDAERIVLAEPGAGGKSWKVLRTLKGAPVPAIEVRTIAPDEGEEALLFLRPVNGAWEPIRFRAGLVAVRDSRVSRWNCSLDEAIARITR